MSIRLKPGVLIVLEGIDGSGKSATMDFLSEVCEWDDPKPLFTHQPSGHDELTDAIYGLTEMYHEKADPLAVQLLHLASHAQHYATLILPSLVDRGVVLDRCWWSTVAYGMFAGKLHERVPTEDFLQLVQLPANFVPPQIVFLFMEEYREDSKSTDLVKAGYLWLEQKYSNLTVRVPRTSSPAENAQFIVDSLLERELAEGKAVSL